jgi:hypothetical protein
LYSNSLNSRDRSHGITKDGARNELTKLDDEEPEAIEKHRKTARRDD